jgi:hypothetical protein
MCRSDRATQLLWPERYLVEIKPLTGRGPTRTFLVLSWLHAHKAVAMAVAAYGELHPDAPIYDVIVSSLGQAARLKDGTVDIADNDLIDRLRAVRGGRRRR